MNNPAFSIKQILLLLLLFVFLVQGCKKDEDNNSTPAPSEIIERGDIISSTSQGIYTTNDIQQMLVAAGVSFPLTLTYSIEIITINYYTIDEKNNYRIVSGALYIPLGTDSLPLLSLQHGTETKRDLVASVSPNNSIEGIVGLVTASRGYLTVIPDYIGFGISELNHPYLHANSIVPSVIDFIRACRSYAASNHIILDGRLFLTGYSEGGYVTLVTQKIIEEKYQNEFSLTGVAPMSGPYDLKGMADTVFMNNNYSTTAYIAYFLKSFNDIYGWNRLNDIFKAPYASLMPGLFNGSMTWGEIVNQLPPSLGDLINPAFISSFNAGNEISISTAFQENTMLDWTPIAPIHFFHGDADNIVPYYNVLTAMHSFTSNGASNIQLTTIAGGTHETTGPTAILGAILWFESL